MKLIIMSGSYFIIFNRIILFKGSAFVVTYSKFHYRFDVVIFLFVKSDNHIF